MQRSLLIRRSLSLLLFAAVIGLFVQKGFAGNESPNSPFAICQCEKDVGDEKHSHADILVPADGESIVQDELSSHVEIGDSKESECRDAFIYLSRGPPAQHL